MRWVDTQIGSYYVAGTAQLTKKKLALLKQGLQILGQSFCTKWDKNISMGSWTIIFQGNFPKLLPIPQMQHRTEAFFN